MSLLECGLVRFVPQVQSCRNKTDDVCDLITQGSYDLVFLTETWFRPTGDECEMAAVTPPGFTLKSVPRANGKTSQ